MNIDAMRSNALNKAFADGYDSARGGFDTEKYLTYMEQMYGDAELYDAFAQGIEEFYSDGNRGWNKDVE